MNKSATDGWVPGGLRRLINSCFCLKKVIRLEKYHSITFDLDYLLVSTAQQLDQNLEVNVVREQWVLQVKPPLVRMYQ